MKRIVLFSLIVINVTLLHAQAPQSFNYQAVARDAAGNVITGPLAVRFTIHEDAAGGSTRYTETHQAVTNAQGVFNLAIGSGSVVNGNIDNINWAQHQYYLQVEIKPDASGSFTSMGTAQLLSVPYAMYAAESGTTLDAGNGITIQNNTITNTGDLSSDNELQTLDVNGNQLSISSGNTVTLPTGTTYTEGAGIDINGNTISANDISATNEIQTLSINGNQLSLSNGGGSVALPAGNSSWTTNGTVTYSNPTSNDVGIGTENNGNAKLNVSSTGSKHAGNFTSPGAGDAVRAYCNGTGAGIRASSLNGSGAVISTGAGVAGEFSSTSGKAGVFTSTTGTAGYFSCTNGKALIVDEGNVGIGTGFVLYKMNVKGTLLVDGDQDPLASSVYIKGHTEADALSVSAYGDGDAAYLFSSGHKALILENSNAGITTGIQIRASQGHWDQYMDYNNNLNFAANGTLRAWILPTDGSYHNSSDRRLKKDIQPFSDVLPGISKLQAYTYHMKDAPDDSPLSVGFMAQEVEQQFPQLVVEKDGYKSLCYDQFAVLSIEAVKEQQVHIDQLGERVKELEKVVGEMKVMIVASRQ